MLNIKNLSLSFLLMASPVHAFQMDGEWSPDYFDEQTPFAETASESSTFVEVFASLAFGKTIGVDQSYSSVGLWGTQSFGDYLCFADFSWQHLCHGENGVNVGIGIRFGEDCKGCGANLYYDWRDYRSKNFNQIGVGIEGWIFPWEFHFNAYLPTQSFHVLNHTSIDFPGDFFLRSKTRAFACQMAVLTAGRQYQFRTYFLSPLTCIALIGPYWISQHELKNRYGGLASVDFKFYDYFSWKTVLSYDGIFRTNVQTILSINIPLGCSWDCLCECFSSMLTRRPDRLDLIPIDPRCHSTFNWTVP